MKECKEDGSQKKSEAIKKECGTSGQTDIMENCCLQIQTQGEAVCIQFFVQQEASEDCEGWEIYDQTQEFDR